MSAVFVDTNVLLYALDDAVSAKRDRAQAWLQTCWRRRCGRFSAQITNIQATHAVAGQLE